MSEERQVNVERCQAWAYCLKDEREGKKKEIALKNLTDFLISEGYIDFQYIDVGFGFERIDAVVYASKFKEVEAPWQEEKTE